MSLLAVQIQLPDQDVEGFSDALIDVGALSVSVADADAGTAGEKPIFGEPGGEPGIWSTCQLTALFPSGADISAMLALAADQCCLPVPDHVATPVEDIDWVLANREQFQPMAISERLWIVPTWHQDAALPDGAVRILLDPGAAFGTGSHPTTRLCLRWLEARLSERQGTMLDYGCGSGILAIAAMKLGARTAEGVDIDDLALETARTNAKQNGVQVSFLSARSAVQAADLVIANILSHPLIMLAPVLAGLTKAGGMLALSGILAEQAEEVIAAYANWFKLHAYAQDEDWVCLSGDRLAP